MADYTLKNLKDDIKDSAPEFGMSPDVEARFAGEDLGLSDAGMAYERAAAGKRTPFGHSHKEQEEIYVVVEGSGRIKLDDEIIELKRLDTVRIGPGIMRCVEGGPDGIAIVAFGAPPIENPQEEAEMVMGWWSD